MRWLALWCIGTGRTDELPHTSRAWITSSSESWASYPTIRLLLLVRKKIGVVDARNSLEIKGLSASACKKKGIPSTVLRTPVPALGERERPKARRNVAWVSSRFPFGKTAADTVLSTRMKSPGFER